MPLRETTPTGPALWMCPGMMPILACPGVMTPGQFGPMSRLVVPPRKCLARTMSVTGMPSVMQMTSGTPAAAASMMASAAAAGGTKISAQSAPSLPHRLLHRVPDREALVGGAALAGRDAADDLRAVLLAARGVEGALLAGDPLHDDARGLVDEDAHGCRPRQRHGLARAVAHVVGHDQRQAGVREHLLALLDVGALGAQDHRQREAELPHRAR